MLSYWSKCDCGGLNMLGPWKVALLGSVLLYRWDLRAPSAQAPPSTEETVSSWLPSDQDIELSVPSPASCLPGLCHALCYDNELSLRNCKPAPVNCCPQ